MTPADRMLDAFEREARRTLPELAADTGYPPGEVLHQIELLRGNGVRVNARRDPGVATGSKGYPAEPGAWTTIFELDNTPQQGGQS
jgi:DNA-binding Lrp family transcriptional regulator